MEAWAGIELPVVAATGNLTQLYPQWASVGVTPPGAAGQEIRSPSNGTMGELKIQTDGANGGVIEIWDINGLQAGADVSSSDQITNAQLVAAVANGFAKLIWRDDFLVNDGSRSTPIYKGFLKGLAGRYTQGGAGAKVWLNLEVQGGYYKANTAGA